MRILGVDPGSQYTGYGIVDLDGNRLRRVDSGCLRLGNGDMTQRLGQIHAGIAVLLADHQPDVAAIESVFVRHNPNSAIKLGQARGAALAAVALAQIPVHEYAPAQVKQTVVGGGRADKLQIAFMVSRLLNLVEKLQEDEADALAVAICHVHQAPVRARQVARA